ncbi:MAG: lipoprotein [Pseudomonadota bacterium]
MKRTFAIPATLLAFAALSACGLRGPLERPDPLFGEPRVEDLEPAAPIENNTTNSAAQEALNDADDELLGGPDGDE